jgi:hypothetical protein
LSAKNKAQAPIRIFMNRNDTGSSRQTSQYKFKDNYLSDSNEFLIKKKETKMIKLSKPSPLEEKAFSYDNRKERNEEANKSPLGSYKREASRDEKRRVSTPQIGVSKELENKFSGLGGQPLSTKAKKVELAVSKELKAKSRVELQGYPASLKDSPIKSTKKGYASQEKTQNIVPLNKRRESGANADSGLPKLNSMVSQVGFF